MLAVLGAVLWTFSTTGFIVLMTVLCAGVVYGPRRRLEQLIRDARIEDRFYRHFRLIPNEEIERYFTACDAAILSYRKSYIGSSGILSLACEYELPVIAADVADMGGTVRQYQIGVPFRPEDPESLANAIRRFLTVPEDELLAMKHKMKSVNLERSWPNIARRHIQVYTKSAGNRLPTLSALRRT